MIDYFANLPPDDAVQMEQLSRLSYELRESRRKLLEPYGVNDEGICSRVSRQRTCRSIRPMSITSAHSRLPPPNKTSPLN